MIGRIGLTIAVMLSVAFAGLPLQARTTAFPGQCGAARLQFLLGQEDGVLDIIYFVPPVRVIRPGDFMTRDYLPNRLNIWIDKTGRISRVTCG